MKDFLEQEGISQPTVPEGWPADGLAAEAGQDGHEDAAGGTSAESPGGRAGAEVSVPGHARPARVKNDPDRKKRNGRSGGRTCTKLPWPWVWVWTSEVSLTLDS